MNYYLGEDLYMIVKAVDFEKNFMRFIKKKGFKTLSSQIKELSDKLNRGEFEGDKITHRDEPTPYDVYKLRLPIPDIKVGKSNGYRVIYMVVTETKIVVLLIIYYKKEQPAVSETYIKGLIDGYFLNSMAEEDEDEIEEF